MIAGDNIVPGIHVGFKATQHTCECTSSPLSAQGRNGWLVKSTVSICYSQATHSVLAVQYV